MPDVQARVWLVVRGWHGQCAAAPRVLGGAALFDAGAPAAGCACCPLGVWVWPWERSRRRQQAGMVPRRRCSLPPPSPDPSFLLRHRHITSMRCPVARTLISASAAQVCAETTCSPPSVSQSHYIHLLTVPPPPCHSDLAAAGPHARCGVEGSRHPLPPLLPSIHPSTKQVAAHSAPPPLQADVPAEVRQALEVLPCQQLQDVLRGAFDPPLELQQPAARL